ncbi:branched-chain amino acid ABC transporter permease [Dactylosporangium maewongense]|uniref:Branched-chain amino acid ABC transporter permease n=1 Tax=Dactylosporangium maewongense TaxID=634393 RepID=A0ABP4PBX7_9ACTN
MTQFLQLLLAGLSQGAIYALLALGFVIVFKAGGVVNFAHPALVLIGAYLTVRLGADGLPYPLAVLTAIAGVLVAAAVIQRFLVYRMAGRSVTAIAIMTIGVDVIIETDIVRRIGSDILPPHDPWQDKVLHLSELTIPQARLAALATSAVLITAFFLWFRFSDWGVAMRAAAEDAETAALMGVRRSRVELFAWLLAGALAAVAGAFITVFPSPGLQPASATIALRAFPAAVIGGLDSTSGAVAGGLIVGVAEVLTQGYASHLTVLGAGFHTVMPYAVMIAVLLARPAGLFGTREIHRV